MDAAESGTKRKISSKKKLKQVSGKKMKEGFRDSKEKRAESALDYWMLGLKAVLKNVKNGTGVKPRSRARGYVKTGREEERYGIYSSSFFWQLRGE